MRPVCVPCGREMYPAKNEFLVKDKAVGNFPSTVWQGDLYKCPRCQAQIVTGFGQGMQIASGPSLDKAVEFERGRSERSFEYVVYNCWANWNNVDDREEIGRFDSPFKAAELANETFKQLCLRDEVDVRHRTSGEDDVKGYYVTVEVEEKA